MSLIRLFIVDDHSIIRAGLRILLKAKKDMDVVGEAVDGSAAFAAVQELEPDVVLLDLTMPGWDGLVTLKHFRKACPSVRVLVLTMHEDYDFLRTVLSLGGSGYLLKSATEADLVSAIRAVAQGIPVIDTVFTEHLVQSALGLEPTRVDSPLPRETVDMLNKRQVKILGLVAQGYTYKDIAEILYRSPKTVEAHVRRIAQKFGLKKRTDFVRFAAEQGLMNHGFSPIGKNRHPLVQPMAAG